MRFPDPVRDTERAIGWSIAKATLKVKEHIRLARNDLLRYNMIRRIS
jgi:hypothetical protein